ncbi:MAG: hypothetical protein WAS25_09605 [Geothrix sp.]|uniref:hypothetical protein n=1 Tax=Geothrix sp. TaxID=1962974 RepID=UPI003BAEC343
MEDLLRTILAGYELPNEGLHGPRHWIRVSRTGLKLAKATDGADPEVVHMFALFHDSRRENEDWDPDHGLRGAELARSMRSTHLTHLNDAQFEQLRYACVHHTDGDTTTDPTIGCCWDADRLDLGRVGTEPEAEYMSTVAGKSLVR